METNFSKIKSRIIQFAKEEGYSKRKIYLESGISNGVLDKNTGLSEDGIEKFISTYPSVSVEWLITGQGQMKRVSSSTKTYEMLNEPQFSYGNDKADNLPVDAIPFFNLPVSAGKSILDNIGSKNFDGYLYNLPNIPKTEYCLPVYGTSMGNEVKEGAYIGVRRLDSWERYINTEHKYLVITKDDRMIKYLEPDPENEEIIWCISPNYPKFKLYKADVLEIHRVTFVLNP